MCACRLLFGLSVLRNCSLQAQQNLAVERPCLASARRLQFRVYVARYAQCELMVVSAGYRCIIFLGHSISIQGFSRARNGVTMASRVTLLDYSRTIIFLPGNDMGAFDPTCGTQPIAGRAGFLPAEEFMHLKTQLKRMYRSEKYNDAGRASVCRPRK